MAGRAGRPVIRESAFWDSSALVPLCVHQSATARAIALYQNYNVVVWWATPVEIISALARLARMGQLDKRGRAQAQKLATDLAGVWSVIQPSEIVRINAMQLVDRHELRAADALQLAAALEWCEGKPQGRVLLTTDQRLRGAATLQGFDAQQI